MRPSHTPSSIRPFICEDCSSLAALSIEVWLTTYLHQGVNKHFADYVLDRYTAAHFQQVLSNPAEVLLVSGGGTGIDGYIRISHGSRAGSAETTCTEISTLYVRPCAQGHGIGQQLLHAGLQACRDRDWEPPWLIANSENHGAIAFYLRNGFETAGIAPFRIQDEEYPNRILQLRAL